MSAVLTSQEMGRLNKVFAKLDASNNGAIDVHDLRRALNEMRQRPTDKELQRLMGFAKAGATSRSVTLAEFTQMVEYQTMRARTTGSQYGEIRSAFQALSGSPDCSGTVAVERVQQVIDRFGLSLSVKELMKPARMAELTFDQFRDILSSA